MKTEVDPLAIIQANPLGSLNQQASRVPPDQSEVVDSLDQAEAQLKLETDSLSADECKVVESLDQLEPQPGVLQIIERLEEVASTLVTTRLID
jgi:hypothetical protein